MMAAGACLGGMTVAVYTMLRGDPEGDADAAAAAPRFTDPPAPKTEQHFPILAEELMEVTQTMSKLVPPAKLALFKDIMRKCIQTVETIASVKHRMDKTEDPARFTDQVYACSARTDEVYRLLVKVNELLSGGAAMEMQDKIDVISAILSSTVGDMEHDTRTRL